MAVSLCYAAEGTAWLAGDNSLIGQGAKSFTSVQSAWNSAAAEASGTGANWGSGNLIMNTTDGLDEYAKLELSNFIRPFHEAGLAAMTPQQDFQSFLSDAKAGKLSMDEIQGYVDTFKANQDAYLGAFEAALNEWMEPYKNQGLMWASE